MAIGSPPDDVAGRRTGTGPPGPEEPLLSNGSNLFEMRNRPRRDVQWLFAYLIVLLGALAGGVFSFLHRNTRYAELTSHGVSDPALCPITATTHSARRLLQQGPDAPSPADLDLIMRAVLAWLGASVGGAILVGLLFVWLVRTSPAVLVWMALALKVAIPAALGIMALTQGMWPVGVLLLGLSGLVVLVFWLWRQQIDLVTRLLGMAGRGLSANPGLVPLALALQLVLVGLMELPLVLAVIAAAMNGTLVYNPDRVDGGSALLAKTAEEQCVDGAGESVPCCVWQTESWVPVYFAFAGIAMTWSLFLAFQIKMYTVAGSTAQWYFQTAAGSETSFSDDSVRRRSPGRTLTSLRHAVGPSLGTLCAGSAVLTLVSMIRQAIQKARREQGNNIVAACVAACLSVLLALMEFVTRFATVRAAITGEAFFTAGRNVVALLSRNAMDAFGVWWLPPLVLQSCSFLLALAWAVAVYLVSYATTWRHLADSPSPSVADQAPAFAALTALVGFLAAWAVLGFLASLMLNVVDSLFVCVGMDRDVGQVSSLEIHTVMSKLPTVGPVVQQPDGGVAYGAPQVYQQPQPQQGPMGRGSVARV